LGAGPVAGIKVLLDTHVLLWWQAGGGRLSGRAARAIEDAATLFVSPLTCWEIATLHRLGRIALDREPVSWVQDLLRQDRISEAPLTPEAATWAGGLGERFAGDPVDRLLYATARDLRIPLVSKDDRLHDFATQTRDVRVIW
jgi:PIN domain nuclease of toxin-antitoxin system